MRIEAIIFDLGGTLLEYAGVYDSWPELEGPGFKAAHEHLGYESVDLPDVIEFQKAGFDILPRRWKQATAGLKNLTVSSLLVEVLSSFSIVPPADEIMKVAASRYQAAVCAGVVPIRYSYETVNTLKASGFKLGLVSNTMFDGKMHIADMRKYKLAALFDAMVFSADVNKWKPGIEIFTNVLDRLDVEANRAVFIGDDPGADVVGGKRAGLYTIHYPSSQRFSSVDGVKPDAIINSLDELVPLVSALNASSRTNSGHTL
jgi:putative hydrolase of the HAD superfamily